MHFDRCGELLIEIDRYGERLAGCVECTRLNNSRSVFIVELSIEDFEARDSSILAKKLA